MNKTLGTTVIAAAFLGLSAGAQAEPISYTFEQGGYADGASVTGSFLAEDTDSNGLVSFDDGEIFDFSLSFSGNSLVETFSLMFDDIAYFVYNLDGLIGETLDDEGIEAGTDSVYWAGPAVYFTDCGAFDCANVGDANGGIDFSSGLINVSLDASQVPEPAAGLLLLTGLVGTGLLIQRRKA